MGISVPFDTLRFVETLTEAGFEERQARGLASAIRVVQETHLEELATKRDLKELENSLKQDSALLRADMQALEYRMTIKLGGMMMVSVGVVAALVKLL